MWPEEKQDKRKRGKKAKRERFIPVACVLNNRSEKKAGTVVIIASVVSAAGITSPQGSWQTPDHLTEPD